MDAKSDLGRLVLLGAPLGNPADASVRLREVLATVDLVAAEDTRRLARLTRDLEVTVSGRIVSYFEGNEERRTPELVEALRAGLGVALVTDGGMPSVSDPGYRLVRAALDAGVPVTAAPGPSAVTTALALSGLASDRFCFEGFLPRTSGPRRARLNALATEERTLVFFESPHRVVAALADLADAFGADRPAALCRELTKTYEQVLRRPLGELASFAVAEKPRGEITLVVAGASAPAAQRPDDEALRAAVAAREATGRSRRDAVTEVSVEYGLRRREVYDIVHR
ncbi:16S rRNA (cytidine(1402)-2'-O)-methyltransferase [Salinispora arenicola]|uniref:Ribosomal RNA small subunit methyltransferase I n=2 Tax=Salinispora arenicola TaxID=168697 RepID=A0A542XI71_SALAC|nr:16S rRNA (cytidine(1402)-2'-O)-methyltransferase [Salinispora arenicola]MCN0152244.1 16S rRNA (cytidine(1402)-2'-O)-methyltransferase [Salinispora arenicola]NIL61971.1 16S rRNA (cytidine(1402)-2'-O)-methyltransferase [Salinispora arenicola]TQL35507.1 16S rRNA (cytidine1402-2'-O)-methyltransferase [Salinispora arenicola]